MAIRTIHEVYTDNLTDLGAAREMAFHMRVEFDDGRIEWHYYGTEPPETRPDAIIHAAVRFPTDFYKLSNVHGLLFDLAIEGERAVLDH